MPEAPRDLLGRAHHGGDVVYAAARGSAACRDACLVHIYPPAPHGEALRAGRHRPVVIGRAVDCEIHIADHSVSRKHARVQPTARRLHRRRPRQHQRHVRQRRPDSARPARRRLPAHRQLHLPLPRGRQHRGGVPRGDLPPHHHRRPDRLHNKRYLTEFLDRELARSVRTTGPSPLIMFDIDRFKAINDDLGHLCGDYVLRELAGRLKPSSAPRSCSPATAARSSPSSCPSAPARTPPRRRGIRPLIEATPFRFDDVPIVITVSVGVACVTGGEDVTPAELTQRRGTACSRRRPRAQLGRGMSGSN